MGQGDWGGGGEGGVGGFEWGRIGRSCLAHPNGEYPKHCDDVKIAAEADKLFHVAGFGASFNGANYLVQTIYGHLTRAGVVCARCQYGRAWIARRRAAHSLGRAMDAKSIAQITTHGANLPS